MNMSFRSIASFLVAALAGGAFFLAYTEYGEENESREFDADAANPDMNTLFLEMRLYGNPDVNINERLWNAYRELEARGESGFLKPSNSTAVVWTELGPWNIGGRIRSLAVSPANPSLLYAGSASGGVWKSTNFGMSWDPCTDGMPLLGIGAVALDPNNPDRIFAGTGEPLNQYGRLNATYVLSKSQGILRSEDAGRTWTMLPWSSGSMGGVHRIAVNTVSADTFLVATMTDLWKTTSGGQQWTRVSSGVFTDVVYKPGDPSTVYAALGQDDGSYKNGVYISTAGGNAGSWRRLSANFPLADSCGRIVIGVSAADPERLYAAVALDRNKITTPNGDFFTVMTSTNGGTNWIRRPNAISKSFTNGQSWYDLAMGVSPTDPGTIFLGGLEIYRSTNGGSSFSKVQGSAHVDIHAFAFKAGDSKSVVVGCDGGVYVSTNLGSAWFAKNNKLGTVQYYGCSYDPSHPTWIYGGTQDNGTHSLVNGSNTEWVVVYGGDGGHSATDPGNSQYHFYTSMSVDGSGNYVRPIVRTGPGGDTWLLSGLNEGTASDRFTWLPVIMFHPADRTKLYTATQFVYLLKNPTGSSPRWGVISTDVAPGGVVTDLAIPLDNTSYMYSASSNGRVSVCRNLTSGTPVWENVSSGLPSRWIADITCDKDDYRTVYAALSGFGSGHAFKTTDAGTSWVNISGDLPDIPAGAILQSKTDGNILFLATDLGVYVTTNGGTNWKRFGDDMPNAVVYDMRMTPDGTLIAATHGRGMWRASSVLDVASPDGMPLSAGFALGQGYPNPASASQRTTVPLTVTRAGIMQMKLFDAAGACVRTVLEQRLEPGEHSVRFDGSGLPAGVYMCAATMHGVTRSRKLIVMP
jgi:photosystem II stability/assembly factor-like uncharacterized protein